MNTLTSSIVAALGLAVISVASVPGQENNELLPLPEGVEVIRDLEFAKVGDQALKLDVYRPFDWADYDGMPVVIWIHGGAWSWGSKDNCPASFLAQGNMAVISINYRLSEQAQWPSQIDDCYAAVRWVRENAKSFGFSDKIGVWGAAAGGHLASLLGTRPFEGEEAFSSRVQAVCNFYGPTDLLTKPANVIAEGRTREDVEQSNAAKLLGKTVMDVPELANDASPLHHASEGDAPVLTVQGEKDPHIPIDQATRFNDKLKQMKVDSTLILLPDAGHGGEAFETDEIHKLIEGFFKSFLS